MDVYRLSLLEVVDSSKNLDDLMAKAIMKASHLAPYSNFGQWNLFAPGILYSQSKKQWQYVYETIATRKDAIVLQMFARTCNFAMISQVCGPVFLTRGMLGTMDLRRRSGTSWVPWLCFELGTNRGYLSSDRPDHMRSKYWFLHHQFLSDGQLWIVPLVRCELACHSL